MIFVLKKPAIKTYVSKLKFIDHLWIFQLNLFELVAFFASSP